MVIGKGGAFIKQVKDDSGAFIQISQKSKDVTLPERVITIIGDKGNYINSILGQENLLQSVVHV